MVSLKRWIWECPYEGCNARSRKPLKYHKAGRHGRYHLKKIHNDYERQPIVKEYRGL